MEATRLPRRTADLWRLCLPAPFLPAQSAGLAEQDRPVRLDANRDSTAEKASNRLAETRTRRAAEAESDQTRPPHEPPAVPAVSIPKP
jgi:hypothetical protein